ncbi:MAG: response regulator [candidate division KSB1 bacterium]|nr:response regulator [candidate division KSB1 bacterium]
MKTKILVADDEPFIGRSLSYVLERSGYEVFLAKDGEEALRLAEEVKPAVAILDVMMPGKTGFEVCQQIRCNPHLRKTRIIILSAKGQASDFREGAEAGADAYLPKPFSPVQIIELVRGFLDEG